MAQQAYSERNPNRGTCPQGASHRLLTPCDRPRQPRTCIDVEAPSPYKRANLRAGWVFLALASPFSGSFGALLTSGDQIREADLSTE
jgi:hypothetical protein